MNRNLVGSIYGRFSIKIAHFVPIGLQTCSMPIHVLQYVLNHACIIERTLRACT
jgi:hypothetical protein